MFGHRRAAIWYWKQVVRSIGPALRGEIACARILSKRREKMSESLLHDIRYGLRTFIKQPAFTIVAVLALALGIGANTAIFSVVNNVLLRPLPYRDADRLVTIWENKLSGDPSLRQDSPVQFNDWRQQTQIFDKVAGWWYPQLNLTNPGREPQRVHAVDVTDDFFNVMGAQPVMGRTFLSGEEKPNTPFLAVISYDLWKTEFNSDPKVLEKTITLDGQPHSIIGVMPAGFEYPKDTQIWRNLGWDVALHSRSAHFFEVTARLKPGITLERAQADLSALAVRIARENPRSNTDWGVTIVPLRNQLLGNFRPALLVLVGAVVFVLLIACANVTNLLLARAAAREKEISIRLALGASRSRLVRQLLTESVLLSLLGAGLGLVLASVGGNLLMAVNPFQIPLMDNKLTINLPVLGFTMAVAVLTSLIFGLIPALQASKQDLNGALKEGGRDSSGGAKGHNIRNGLVVAEVAITLVLLIGAGLLLKSFLALQKIDPGFNASNVLTFDVQLPEAKYKEWSQVSGFYSQLVEHLKTIPGVRSAAATAYLPLDRAHSIIFTIVGRPVASDSEQMMAQYRMVTPDYFETMSIPIERGRTFEARENADATGVVIINQAAAKRYWGDEDPIGKHINSTSRNIGPLSHYLPQSFDAQIVGVVGDEKNIDLNSPTEPSIYFPQTQFSCRKMSLVVRTAADPLSISNAVRNTVWSMDGNMPVSNLLSMDQIIGKIVAQPKFSLLLLGIFALLALILSGVGIYGVMAYSVSQRTHEMGLRVALGAQPGSLLLMILSQGLKFTLLGVAIGGLSALILTRVMKSLLYGVSTTDPITFLAVSGILIFIAALACYIPARRATRMDPLTALRYQ